MKINKPQIRSIPRQNCPLVIVTAVLQILSGAAVLAFRQIYRFEALFPLWPSIALIVAGALLTVSRKRAELFMVFAVVLAVAMTFYLNSGYGWIPLLAALFVLISTAGGRFNAFSSSLPGLLRRPAPNLAAAAFALVGIVLFSMETAGDYARYLGVAAPINIGLLIIKLLPLISVLLVNFAIEPQKISGNAAKYPVIAAAARSRAGGYETATAGGEGNRGVFAAVMHQLFGEKNGEPQVLSKTIGVIIIIMACLSIIAVVFGLFGIMYAYIAGAYMRDYVSPIIGGGIGFISSLVLLIAINILRTACQATSAAPVAAGQTDFYRPVVTIEENPDELPEL